MEVFSGLAHQFFSEIQHGVRGPCVVVHDRTRFFEKKKEKSFCPKYGENGPKIGFFKFIGKFSHQSFLNLLYNESL